MVATWMTYDIMPPTHWRGRHIAFGHGAHLCLGMHLARLELKILFEELLPHIESIELTEEPKLSYANFVNGLKTLPVRVKWAA